MLSSDLYEIGLPLAVYCVGMLGFPRAPPSIARAITTFILMCDVTGDVAMLHRRQATLVSCSTEFSASSRSEHRAV